MDIEVHEVHALDGHVIIQQLESQKMVGSIYIPKEARRMTSMAVVVSVGEDIDPDRLQVGDIVGFDEVQGRPFEVDGVTLRDMVFDDIHSKLMGVS